MALSLDQASGKGKKKGAAKKAAPTRKTKPKPAAKAKTALKKVAAQKTRPSVKPWQTAKVAQTVSSAPAGTAAQTRVEELIQKNLPRPVLDLINKNVAGGVHSLVSQGFLLFEMGKSLNSEMVIEELRSRQALIRQKALKLQEKLPMPKALAQILAGR